MPSSEQNPPSAAPLRVLIVCTGRIDRPRSGGELRVRHLAEGLAEAGHTVRVEAFVLRNHPAGESQPRERLSVRLRHSLWLDAAALADRARLAPVTELPAWLRPLRGWMRRMTEGGGWDVVHCELPWFAALQRAVAGGARVIYGAQNIESEWWAGRLRERPLGEWFLRRLARHEAAAARTADGIIACTPEDGARLGAMAPGRPVAVVGNGYDAGRVGRPTPQQRAAARAQFGFGHGETIALFIGSDTAPNREALALAARELAGARGVRLVAAGRVCEGAGGLAGPNLTLLGPMEDVLGLLHAADAGLNPMLSGSGSNLKLIEYLAAGLPVATTEFGLRGFEALRQWVTICEPGGLAAAVAGMQWPNCAPAEALKEYGWDELARGLAEFYRKIRN